MTDPIVRLVRNEFELRDVAERLDRAIELVERDFALTTIAVKLVEDYGDKLCFKGGFVLRHVYGHGRPKWRRMAIPVCTGPGVPV